MNAPVDVGRFGSGHAVRRIEDPALIAGRGNFTDDVVPSGQTHLVFLRSPYAHARIVSVDTSAARGVPWCNIWKKECCALLPGSPQITGAVECCTGCPARFTDLPLLSMSSC